jgi:hypothetical protein
LRQSTDFGNQVPIWFYSWERSMAMLLLSLQI